jgi:DNA-binding NarL/FixJ family response regulator
MALPRMKSSEMLHMRPAAPLTSLASALIIDDHPLFCDALSMTLTMVVGIENVHCVNSLDAALARLRGGAVPDLAMLDLNLPDVSGLDGLLRLKAEARGLPVVVVSSVSDPAMVRSAIRLGASAFVPKHSPREVFRTALDAVARGEVWVPEDISLDGAASEDRRAEVAQKLAQLTRQQARILQLICEGQMNKQIAWELKIAETTVKAHVTEIMRKLGVVTRTQALLLAREGALEEHLPDRDRQLQ